MIRLIVLAEKVCPHSSSVIALVFRVDTPCTYISARALTNAFSERLIPVKQLRREPALPVPGHPELQLADPRH